MLNLKFITFSLTIFLSSNLAFSQDNAGTQNLEQQQAQGEQEKPVTVGEPGEPITMGGRQEELLSELAPEEESEAELKVNVMASAAAMAQFACSVGDEAESFKSVQEAALEYLEKENSRVIGFKDKVEELQQDAQEKNAQRENGGSFDYQIEGLKLQMKTIQMMIQSYMSEENGSITNRNKLIAVLEQAELMALEEFENFENETNTCRSLLMSSKERAEEGCERIAEVEVCEDDVCEIVEQPDPEEGSCEAVDKIESLGPKLSEYVEHYASIMGSTAHKERYEQIKEVFQGQVAQVPSGAWKGQVVQCNSNLQELNEKTEVACELNMISEEDELSDEELERREEAQVASFEEQPDAFSSLTSSDSEKRYLEYATMKKQAELDPYMAQSLNRPVLYPVIIEDLVAQNQVELQKVQAHYEEYEKILNLYSRLKDQQGQSNLASGSSEGESEKSVQSNQGVEQNSPVVEDGLASNVAFDGGDGFSASFSNFGSVSGRGASLSSSSTSNQSDTALSGTNSKNEAGNLNTGTANLGRSSALSRSQIRRKDELEKRAKGFVKNLSKSSPVAQKREESIKNSRRVFGAALTRKAKTTGGFAKRPESGLSNRNSSFTGLESELDQGQSGSSRGASFISRSRSGEKTKTLLDEGESKGKKTSRLIGYKKTESNKDKEDSKSEKEDTEELQTSNKEKRTRLEQSQREIARIYNDYKKSGNSFKSSRSGGEIGEREDDLFEIITRRYIVSGFKRLDGVDD